MSTQIKKTSAILALLGSLTVATALAVMPANAAGKSVVAKSKSFQSLKSHAKDLSKAGVAKVKPIRRHGRKIGFTKTLKSGDTVRVTRKRHGRASVAITKKPSFLARTKHKASAFKHRVAKTYRAAKRAWFGPAKARRH